MFGSWPSMLLWSGLIVVWIGYKGYVTTRYVGSAGFDPYPLILRNVRFSPRPPALRP